MYYDILICFSLAGMSRSVTIAAAYIMSATTIKLKHVLRLLKACRSIASPNEGFNKQLQYYECNYLLEVRNHHRKYFLRVKNTQKLIFLLYFINVFK